VGNLFVGPEGKDDRVAMGGSSYVEAIVWSVV